VPFHDGIGDYYAVCVSAKGYRDGGCFFKANPKVVAQPKVLLLGKDPTPKFDEWDPFVAGHPVAAAFLAAGQSEAEAREHYIDLGKTRPAALACLLNLVQAISEIDLDGKTPLSFFKQICWDNSMAQDRFFGYADPALIPAVRSAAEKGMFAEEKDCAKFHPGSTCSWKQTAFAVTNVQLTFHENDTKEVDGVKCVKVEPDIDLYKDLLAHGFCEVFPNTIDKKLTNPFDVYSMRWTVANDEGGPEFDPGYELA
jgi:hypothetical protein